MTALYLADAREAADFAVFLARLLRWDKAAVVRLQAADGVLALFGQPPFGGVLAVRTARLAAGPDADRIDVDRIDVDRIDATVSAGQLLDGIDEDSGALSVPPGVTGPAWAGLLPPRSGWRRLGNLVAEEARAAAARTVGEFRVRTEALAPERRTRAGLDALADEIWSRAFDATALPLRAVHAAHALGFLRPVRIPVPALGGELPADEPLVLLAAGPWLRLRTPYGSVAVRRSAGLGLSVAPA